jgi:hypothetical protein
MNGLLLVAHVDKLFDSYLLSFDASRDGFRPIHPRVRQEVAQLGLKSRRVLNASQLRLEHERRFGRYMSERLKRHRGLVAADRPTE